MLPLSLTLKFVPLTTVLPVPVPKVKVPDPFCCKVRLVFVVDGEIVGLEPAKVKAVEVKVLPFIVLSTVNVPAA